MLVGFTCACIGSSIGQNATYSKPESVPTKHPRSFDTSDKTLSSSQANPCRDNQVLVEGDFCPSVDERCLRWLDPDNKGANGPARCAEFAPTRCLSKQKKHMRFCQDRYEWPNQKDVLPTAEVTWEQAKTSCADAGKRLCTVQEFTFACEGEDMKPYPYEDGFHRDADACNQDNDPVFPFMRNKRGRLVERPFELLDRRTKSGSKTACVTTFGAYDVVGNVDEFVYNPSGKLDKAPYVSGMMGGHWVRGARNRCRPVTEAHGPRFSEYAAGFRCCSDVVR